MLPPESARPRAAKEAKDPRDRALNSVSIIALVNNKAASVESM